MSNSGKIDQVSTCTILEVSSLMFNPLRGWCLFCYLPPVSQAIPGAIDIKLLRSFQLTLIYSRFTILSYIKRPYNVG
ncbi:SIT4 phosphatase-associated family protein [Paludibacter propionicigenes WB4]|uniref:SIT4 phosphatase-associated family protein n=1 Tax=Paludibacter propionicigenes (strain DSM 17365 / JCM 13257 / WB4) TaxID=694427 RepID=E4T684_PALPW|nr:SIT4 phosphatase-associated family protein [Paludibacter propionicigenes WB4]